jgi:hypothetical protein
MISFAARRLFNLWALVIASVVALFVFQAYSVTLSRSQYLSGWFLLAAVVFLAAYNVRKKLPFLPLGSSAAWLQFHIFVGWFTFFLFMIHVEFRVPNGFLESFLALLYLVVALSGALGLWISKGYPPRIARHDRAHLGSAESENRKFGEELIFERIPIYIREVREHAEELVVRSGEESKSSSIADFYSDRLHDYFSGPRNFWLHNMESSRPLDSLIREVVLLLRYLSEKEQAILVDLSELIRIKNQLDYRYALQAMLKRWLFCHMPLTYCLLILAAAHVVVVYAFSSGAQ